MNPKTSKPAGISEKVIRLLDVYTLMAQDRFPPLDFLKDRLEMSERSVYRYLEIINMIDPIEYDKERKGYKFVHGSRIKKLMLSEEDFILLLTLGETISHMGTPFKDNFSKFVERFLNITGQPSIKDFPILIKSPDAIESERFKDHFKAILDCIHEHRSIDIVYKTMYSKEIKQRRIDPYGLVLYGDTWILIGYCHLRECIRHFAIDMIQNLKETELRFLPPDFSIEEHLSHSLGVYDEEPVDVTVRFSSEIAHIITRKQKWHPFEKRTFLPTGEVEFSFRVAGIHEIKRWIYSWIPNVQVTEPKWFKDLIEQELTQTLKNQS